MFGTSVSEMIIDRTLGGGGGGRSGGGHEANDGDLVMEMVETAVSKAEGNIMQVVSSTTQSQPQMTADRKHTWLDSSQLLH